MNDTNQLLTTVDGELLRVTINRPAKRNALSLALLDSIGAAFREHRHADLKCAVITGAGDKAFAAGDIRIGAAHADLGLIQSQLGLTTAWGGGIDLINAVGNSAALAILCAGRRIGADEALTMRLYEAVCPAGDDFAAFTEAFLGDYLNKSSNVLRGYKTTAAARRRQLHEELTDIARDAFVTGWVHDDHWDAAARALKK